MIRISHGTAAVELEPVAEVTLTQHQGTRVSYEPRDVLDAAATALLAVNTPDAAAWADTIYRLAAGQTPTNWSTL